MFRRIVGFSIQHPGVVIALSCVAAGYGVYVAAYAKRDVFPEFAPPQVVIQTEAPGLSPEEVEQLVTRPIENAVNGVGNLESVRSQSIQGLSVVTAIFAEGTRVLDARQTVAERLVDAAGRMPLGVRPPTMAPLTSATSTVLDVGLTSAKRSLMELRSFADWTLRPRLLGVPGIAKVVVFGGEVRQLQVEVKPDGLMAYGLAIDDVLTAAREATGVRGAGFLDNQNQRIVLRTEGQSLGPEALGEVVLASGDGMSVRLRDVARVAEGPEPKFGDASINGEPGVLLMLSSQYGANTKEVTEAAERALAEMKPVFDAENITVRSDLFRPASFIETAMRNVTQSMLVGGILVAVVLFLFLFNVRTAFISLTAIPLSLLIAVVILNWFDVTLNTLTLGGLAIAIGEVVDDAIIDVENIFRRLRENRSMRTPASAFRVVLNASLEVRKAVVYATFVVALVFLPVLTMSGIQGRLFAPLGIAYILAVLASLGVALTLTPALSLVLLGKVRRAPREPWLSARLRDRYRRLLEGISRRPNRVIAGAVVLCAASLAALPGFGGAFLPELREGRFIIHMSAVPGTSIEESLRLGNQVARELLKNPHIHAVSQQVGRAEQSDDTWGTHYSEFATELVPLHGEEAEAVQTEVRDAVAKFPGVYFAIKPFLTERIEETVSGVTAEVAVKIFGDDLDAIDGKAREVARVISGIEGAVDVQVESPPGTPEVVLRLRADRLKQFGFRPVPVMEAIQTAFQGAVVGQIYEGNRVFDVAVILDPAGRRDVQSIGSLMLRNPQGLRMPLNQLADIGATTGRYAILHEGAQRRQAVTCNVRGRDVASFVAEAKRRILEMVRFPAGVYPVFAGAAEAQAQARRQLLLHSTLAGVGILLLLGIAFGSVRNLLLVLCNLPFALAGGVLAVFFTGGWLTVGSLVGFVTLFGITTRNSIMMISHFDHLVNVEGEQWGLPAVIRGASERLLPILMTALVTALGLLPIAVGSGEAGREIEGPMAIVILGGLATSTLLNLLVLPMLALRYGRFGRDTETGGGYALS